MAFALCAEKMPRSLLIDLCSLGMEVIVAKLSALTIQPTIMEKFKQKAREDKRLNFFVAKDGVLGYKGGRICVPNDEKIKK